MVKNIQVVECGNLYSYTIPSFSVITVTMKSTKIIDGFVKDTPSMKRLYPAELLVNVSCEKACYVEVSG